MRNAGDDREVGVLQGVRGSAGKWALHEQVPIQACCGRPRGAGVCGAAAAYVRMCAACVCVKCLAAGRRECFRGSVGLQTGGRPISRYLSRPVADEHAALGLVVWWRRACICVEHVAT